MPMKDNTKLCPNCQEEISEKALKCPHCRSDLRSWWRKHPIISLFIAITFLWGLMGWLQNSDPQYQAQQVEQETQKNAQMEANKEVLSKVEVVSKKVYDSYGFTHLWVKIKNNTWKDIDALELLATFKNNFGEPVKEKISNDEGFKWRFQELIKSWKTIDLEVQLSLFDGATTVDQLSIYRVHFTDWTTVEMN